MAFQNINTLQNQYYNNNIQDYYSYVVGVTNLGQRFGVKGDGITSTTMSIGDIFSQKCDFSQYDYIQCRIETYTKTSSEGETSKHYKFSFYDETIEEYSSQNTLSKKSIITIDIEDTTYIYDYIKLYGLYYIHFFSY